MAEAIRPGQADIRIYKTESVWHGALNEVSPSLPTREKKLSVPIKRPLRSRRHSMHETLAWAPW